ncbi:hypothetical protein, partial [Photorhabdus luminescens]|uniref:hypothetical protein n=1 Tax=Photorhabdus luminescens TaxID=29488 RepID=UPI001C3E5F57
MKSIRCQSEYARVASPKALWAFRLLTKCWFFIRHFVLMKFRSPDGACRHVKNTASPNFPARNPL